MLSISGFGQCLPHFLTKGWVIIPPARYQMCVTTLPVLLKAIQRKYLPPHCLLSSIIERKEYMHQGQIGLK